MNFQRFYKEDISEYGKDISDESRPTIHVGDIEDMAYGLKPYKTVGDVVLYDNGDGIIAKVGNQEVGFILKMGNETDFNVAKEFQRRGIGTILGKEFWERYPEHRKLT